ncbi:uncharacterized protein [Typha latifolia]|uniref:uncharacterized protein n=1 Tax=Typha latifolia TaxID=4733 RepID=UPI003C2DAD1E
MQTQLVCCSAHRLPPFSPLRRSSTPSSATRFLSLSFRKNRVLRGPFRASRNAVSYLPNSESSNEVKDAAPSVSNSHGVPVAGSPESRLIRSSGTVGRIGLDPFRGKSGSVSFCGLTHQMLEERKLVSSPFEEGKGSLVWILGPLALVASLVFPQFFLSSAIEAFLRDEILAEILSSFCSEIIFYVGLASFLSITDRVQRPYLEFSSKRWSLITGLKGYLSSAFFTMGFKVFAPLLAAYVVWPVIGLPAVVAVAPFLLGCAAQFAFEIYLDKRRSSCWPLLPIIFEVYRLYQLNKGAHFVERLMLSMRGSSTNLVLMERGSSLISMLVVLQILGVVCLWSLITFLVRLFPSRPVAENY